MSKELVVEYKLKEEGQKTSLWFLNGKGKWVQHNHLFSKGLVLTSNEARKWASIPVVRKNGIVSN